MLQEPKQLGRTSLGIKKVFQAMLFVQLAYVVFVRRCVHGASSGFATLVHSVIRYVDGRGGLLPIMLLAELSKLRLRNRKVKASAI
eukprot:4630731-Amphidinium_carterae.2